MNEQIITPLDVTYRPVWQPETTIVDLFYARPILRGEDGEELAGRMPLTRQPTVEATMATQVKYLNQAFQALHMRFERGERFRMAVRINSVALATNEAASEVTETFRILNKDERAHIVPVITDFPKSLSLNTLDEITIPLMAFFDTWIAQPEKEQSDFTPFANLNYAGVCLNLEDKAMPLKLAGQVLQLFVQRASHRRLPVWVLGLPTQEMANVARISGANFLSGRYMDMDAMSPGPILEDAQPFMV